MMFQNCQVCEFCRLELFQYRAFAAPFKALTLLYTLRRIQPLQTFINFTQSSQTPPPGIPGHFKTTTDTNRHQTTPADVARHRKRLFKDMWQIILTSNGVCWRLTVSDDVLYCLYCLLMLKGCLRNLSTGI